MPNPSAGNAYPWLDTVKNTLRPIRAGSVIATHPGRVGDEPEVADGRELDERNATARLLVNDLDAEGGRGSGGGGGGQRTGQAQDGEPPARPRHEHLSRRAAVGS